MLFPGYLRRLWTDVVTHRIRLGLGLAYVALLTTVSLFVQDQFPFSHFPMYGNPRPKPVDYLFLADGGGTPISVGDYAGISAPQIKKRLSTLLKKKDGELLDAELRPTRETLAAAQKVLEQMRRDAVNSDHARLLTWPAGVQLKLGLIHTLQDGFNETFYTVASLPDAGPAMKGVPGADESEAGDAAAGFYFSLKKLLMQYGAVLLLAVLIVLMRKRLPGNCAAFLLEGTQGQRTGRLEAFCFRAGLAMILWHCLQNQVVFHSLPHPAGLAIWFPRAVLWFGQAGHWELMLQFAGVLLVWYVAGWGVIVPVTLLTIFHCLGRSLYASQGAPHHGQNLVALVFLAQTIASWAQLLGRAACMVHRKSRPDWLRLGNWTAHWLLIAATVASTYFITFATKWDKSDGNWISNAHYFSNQIVKTYRQNYYNDLNPRYLEGVAPKPPGRLDPENDRYRHPVPAKAAWMLQHPDLTKAFFALGLLLEGTAFLLIFRRSWAAMYGAGIIAFHVMVLHLMELVFVENLLVVGIALLNIPGWIIWWSNRRNHGNPGTGPGALRPNETAK